MLWCSIDRPINNFNSITCQSLTLITKCRITCVFVVAEFINQNLSIKEKLNS